VTHYVNGRSISREPICCDAILQIGDAEIGNWGFPRPQSRTARGHSQSQWPDR